MTAAIADLERPSTTCDLPYGEVPWRVVTGNPTIATETDADGSPLTLTVDTPPSQAAVDVLGGELALWRTAQALRNQSAAWQPPAGVTTTRLDQHTWLVNAPGGQLVIRRTTPTLRAQIRTWLRHAVRPA